MRRGLRARGGASLATALIISSLLLSASLVNASASKEVAEPTEALTVNIVNVAAPATYAFSPQHPTTQVGQTVFWPNLTGVRHFIYNYEQHTFDQEVNAGATGEWDTTGQPQQVFPYECLIHPAMADASITLSGTTPTPTGTPAPTPTPNPTPTPTPTPTPNTTPFTDIAGNPFFGDITWLWQSGITSGCTPTLFCPNKSVTRGEMAAFLARGLELPPATTDYFTDDETSIFEASINSLAAAGIASGCTPTTFCPLATITRGQMAAFLKRALELPNSPTDFFVDDETSPFEADINAVANAGIASGCSTTMFCPNAVVTRGQMAAFLHRALGS